MFDRLGVDCVLDVGAMDGRYGEMLRGIGYRGPILSFEPVARNLDLLERKVAGDPLWTVVPLALGSADEERTIHVLSATNFSSLLPINPYGRRSFPGETDKTSEEVVTIRRLDGLMPELTSVPDDSSIFLKLDTQGYDLEVLAGAAGCLDRVVGLQIEMSLKPIYSGMPDMTEALTALRELGFDPTGVSSPRRYPNQSKAAAEPSRRVISHAGHWKEKMYPKPWSKTPR